MIGCPFEIIDYRVTEQTADQYEFDDHLSDI